MKKITLLFIAIYFLAIQIQAQSDSAAVTDTVWRKGGIIGLNFNQASFSNWAAGGQNNISGNVLFAVFANYKRNKWNWDNDLDAAFGGSKTGKDEYRKTDDRFIINSKVGREISKNLAVTYLFNFRTQFTEGFEYPETGGRTRISNFLTPASILNAFGLDWKPAPDLSLFLSPLTIRTTIVNDQLLIDQSELAGLPLFGVDPGEKMRNEFGAYFVGNYKKEIFKNVVFATKIELFSNYAENPQNVDVNWDVLITMKINKFINAIINTQLLYDNDVFVPKTDVNAPPGPGTQFRETLGIGFSYKFEGYGVK